MSQAGGKKGGGVGAGGATGAGKDTKNSKESKQDESKDNKTQINKTGSKDNLKDKDETGSNADAEDAPSSKPQSAGATTRDGAQRVLTLCQKGEWGPVDQLLKSIEKTISGAGEDANTVPLLGISDVVRKTT